MRQPKSVSPDKEANVAIDLKEFKEELKDVDDTTVDKRISVAADSMYIEGIDKI